MSVSLTKNTPALSIRQPWAWLIIRPDLTGSARDQARLGHMIKDVENRSWPTGFRGRLLIHAGKKWGPDERADRQYVMGRYGIAVPETMDLGGIIGSVEMIGCVTSSPSPWFVGDYGFVMKNQEPMEFIPCRGALGFFQPVIDVKNTTDRTHRTDGGRDASAPLVPEISEGTLL